ncbi:ankyrin repeat domain-containing protein 36C-like isoform X8 [Trachemys scripta elegans]|uniref:ankyrin repeat domain-containing protein 36C-like isoform X8 n=1 Tax=Trachemys scripta elegans TaxID=31138 RepID=UPI0015555D1B|nr:ankyrin repeat domain-containing protein 36C-like isoform X8 [Trachemys scripta elegans]
MKKIFGFGKKKKGQSPACRASLPGVGYELREKELGKLHRAAAGGDLGKLQQLLKKHDINQLDKENRTPLHLACANGHLDVVTYLVDNKCKLNLCDNNNRSPLMKAVQCQQEKCATMLLEHGAEPNLVDVNSNTALHLAAQTANISLVVQLLEYNAHIDSQNKEGYTPLTIAITENHQEMVEFLLKKGADVHARDKSKRTPLMIAASGGELSLIKVLLQYGADVSHKDINGWTSEDHARIGGYSSLSKQLSEYANWKNVEKPSPNNTKGMSVFSSPDRVGDVGFALGAPATDKEEMQQSPNQTSRTRDSGKVIDDLSQGDSVRSSEKDEGDDSWLTSEEEELDFTPKKPQKPSLTLLMNSSHQFKKNNGEDIRIGSPQSSRQNLKQVTRNHTNVDKKERKELTNEDISEASKQEKEELEEEEEDEEEFSQEEKEDEDTEDEEGSQDDYTEDEEEEYVGKLEHEHDQELEIFNNAVKSEREVKRGSKNIHDGGSHETCEEKDQEMQESVDIPVSFIAGHYEGLKENITAISSKMVNNEVPYDSSKKEDGSEHEEIHEFQNTNELLHTDGNEKIRCKTRCSFEDSEMTAWKKDASPSVLNSCYIKEENSNLVDDIFESDDDPWSEAENRRYENRRQDSENLRFLVDQNAGKEQCKNSEGLANTICETLEPESENLPVNSGEENLKAFQPSIKEESSEEEDDIEQPQISNVVDKSLICSGNREAQNPSEDTAIRKDTMSVLGLDEEEDTESPWDSECASESPRKLPVNLLISSAIRTDTHMQSIFEEPNEGFCEKTLDSQPKTTQAILETHDTSSCPAKGIEIGKRQKSDLMEELGLDDADDIEDASDWDSTSISLKNLPGTKSPKVLTFGNPSSSLSTLTAKDDAAATASGVIPSRLEEMSKAQTVTAPENTHLYSLQKQLLPVILKSKDELSEPSFNMPSPDEEREDAGENCKKQKTMPMEGTLQDGFSEELESIHEAPHNLTKPTSRIEGRSECMDLCSVLEQKESSNENVISYALNSSSHEHPNQYSIRLCEKDNKPCTEHIWNANEEGFTNNAESTKVAVNKEREDQIAAMETEENVDGNISNLENSPGHSPKHSLKESILDKRANIPDVVRPVSTDDKSTLLAVAKIKRGKDSYYFKDNIPKDCFVGNPKTSSTEIESNLGNSRQSHDETLKRPLDEELEQDMERFKNEVGMLQIVFLALEKEKVQLQKEVEEEKRKQKCGEMLAMEKREDTYKSYMQTLAGNGINQQMKQKLAIKGNQYSTVESGETTEEEKHMKNSIPSKERAKLIQIPLKGSNSALNVKDVKKNENKKRISKQRGNQQMNSTNGNQFQVLDDSTLSETSQDEGRPGAKTVDERNKIGKQMDVADDFDELTQSSDTATEDLELPTSTYRDAMLLIEQLCMDGKADSISLLKIQNLLHGYERLIDHEKGRYTQLLGKVRKLENEKKELQTVLEETRELKSMLDHQKMEWESDVSSLKFTLKQEEEKRMSAEMLYEKNRELLRKKEDQYCKEMEEKQQLELTQRSLEMELRTLRNHLKQVEEERNEIQRQLSQEQSARALQEGILNNHLWKQKEIEEETKITVAKSSEVPDNQREKDLLHKNQILQDEIAILRLELDQIRIRHQEEETKYLEENEVLREKNEDLRKELKLNEEALTQTVFQYNGQLNVLKTESAMLTSKIEHAKENKDRLETEMESFRSRLNSAVQELECCRKSKSDVERTLQREHDEWLRLQDKLNHDLSNLRDSNTILSQQLSKVETKANSLENELHHVTHTLREKTLLLESTQRDLSHAQCQAKELDHARQIEKDQMSKYIVKQESMQERLAQLQSENILLRQQLEDMQNKGIIKEKVVSDVQDRFSDIFSKLRADTEKQVHMMEERNKELITKCNNLREQVFKYDTEKVEREGTVRQLQQELADALKKQSMSEASLEVTTRYRNDLEDDKLHLQKEIDKIKTKLQESEDQYIQSERRVHDLKNALDSKEREVNASSQKLQDLLIASSGTNNAIKQLEEHIQRLEIENARLEATTKQQTSRIEVLQKDLRDSASVHNRLEDLITGLQTAKINLEEQLNQQVQKQTMLSMTAKDTHNLWEEELKSRSKLGVRLSQLDREKAEMLEQFESERKKVKKLVELKRSVDVRLDQEMKRNSELQKECNGMKKLLKTAKKKLKEYETGECVSQFSFQGELKNRYSEMDNEVSRLRTKTDELSKKLDIESKKSTQLESTNRDLREQLSSMKILHKNHEKLEKSKWQLEGEVANLKHQVETNMMDHSQIEQYKREIEERARQEIRQKLEEVNLFLQTQAASQETLEQIRTTNNASLRNQLEHRIRDLESELARIKNTQEDSVFQKQSTQTELERYKDLYLEELKIRKSLASKLDRANERIAEANAKLLHERHRSKSLIANSIVNGSLAASPVLDTTQLGNLGNNLTLNRSLGLGGSFINPTGNALSSKNRVEAYLAKMQQELEKSITKELDQATAELETGSVRVSPVGSTDGSSKNLNVDQDPVSRATQQYLDVLKKNYMI